MNKPLLKLGIIVCLFLPLYSSSKVVLSTTALTAELNSPSGLTLERAKAIRSTAVAMKQRGEERAEAAKIIELAQQKIAALEAAIDPAALAKAEARGKAAQIAQAAADAAAYLQKEADARKVQNYNPAIDITYSTPSDADVYKDAIRQALVAQTKSPFPNKEGVVAFINEATHKLYVDINSLYSKPSSSSSAASSTPAPVSVTTKHKKRPKKAQQQVNYLANKHKKSVSDLSRASSQASAAQANVARLAAELSIKENDLRDAEAELTKQKAQLADANQRNKSLADSLKALQPQLSAAQRTATAVTAERDAALARIARAEEKARLATAALTAPQAAIQHAELDLSTKTRELQVALAQLDQAQLGITNAQQAADRETARATTLERELATAQRTISDNETAYAKALDEASRLTSDAQSRTITPARSDTPTSPPPSSPISIGGNGSPRAATPETTAEPEVFGMTQKDILIPLQQYIISGKKFAGSKSKNNIIDIGTKHNTFGANTSNLDANMPLIKEIILKLAKRTDATVTEENPIIKQGLERTREQLNAQYEDTKEMLFSGIPTTKRNTITLEELAGALFLNLQKATKGTAPATQTSTSGLEGIELPTIRVSA